MAKRTKFTISHNISLPLPSAEDLRGRQSVRATFKLSARAIDALSIVAVHLGIKQKSLFDQLIEDAGSLSHIAREIESDDFATLERVQKTYVISRRTLRSLEDISRTVRCAARCPGGILHSAVVAGNSPGARKTSETQGNTAGHQRPFRTGIKNS